MIKTCPICKEQFETRLSFQKYCSKFCGSKSRSIEPDKKAKRNKDHRERVAMLREWYNEYKATLKCNRCGFNNWVALEFHHKNPNEKENTVGELVRSGAGKERIMREIEKCEVLCANCHKIEHFREDADKTLFQKNKGGV